jgi:hypothetical protein
LHVRVPSTQIEVAEAEADLRELLERRRSAPLGDRLLIDGLDRSIDMKRERLVRLRAIQAALARARATTQVG